MLRIDAMQKEVLQLMRSTRFIGILRAAKRVLSLYALQLGARLAPASTPPYFENVLMNVGSGRDALTAALLPSRRRRF